MSKAKICVVGAGMWGINHVRTLWSLGNLGGVVDASPRLLAKIKDSYPEVKVYDSLDGALIEGFDGFTVATPAETHYKIAARIISEGKHVLVEKPITLNSIDAENLCKLAKQKNVNLMVGHVLLFHPAFAKIKSMVDNGDLGKLQYLYSNRLNLGKIRTEENVFWSLAPHDIALFQSLIGKKPVNITSRGMDILQDGIHDTTMTTIEYPGAVMGHIFVSWLHPFKEHRFVIVGSKGMIRFEDSAEGKPLLFYDKSVTWENGIPKPVAGASWYVEYENSMPLTEEMKYFVDCIHNKPPRIADGESAAEVIKILETANKSLNNGN